MQTNSFLQRILARFLTPILRVGCNRLAPDVSTDTRTHFVAEDVQ